MKKLLAISIACLMIILGCGKQDPLDGQPDWVRDAKPWQKPGEQTSPEIRDYQMIITPSATQFLFQEETEASFSITGRVAVPSATSEIFLINQSDFPASKFDQATGEFRWKPAKGFVTNDTTQVFLLRVKMAANMPGTTAVWTKDKEIPVVVHRSEGMPSITKVDDLTRQFIREKTSKSFQITIQDEDANDVDGQRPRLLILPGTKGDRNIASYVTQDSAPKRMPNNPKLWVFPMTIDLASDELTDYEDDFTFVAAALNRFGKISAEMEVRARIRTGVDAPIFLNIDPKYEIEAQKAFGFEFMVMDVKNEGEVTVTGNSMNWPGGPKLDCKKVSGKQAVRCDFNWTPDLSAINLKYKMVVTANNKSRIPGDNVSSKQDFTAEFTVTAPTTVKPPTPPPTPSPTPTPVPIPVEPGDPEDPEEEEEEDAP